MEDFRLLPRPQNTTVEDFMAVYSGPCRIPCLGINASTLAYLFRDQWRAGIARLLDEVVAPIWPEEVGLPRAERIQTLQAMARRRDDLRAEREKIRAAGPQSA